MGGNHSRHLGCRGQEDGLALTGMSQGEFAGVLGLAGRDTIDVMIDAHVWMRRRARVHGEWRPESRPWPRPAERQGKSGGPMSLPFLVDHGRRNISPPIRGGILIMVTKY